MKLKIVSLDSIKVGDRFRKEYKDIPNLVVSISINGLIQPLAVSEGKDGTYNLLAGGRRYMACQKVKSIREKGVPVRIYPDSITEKDARAIELAENIDREDLTWQEEVALKAEVHRLQCEIHGLKNTKEGEGWTQGKTAELFGVSQAKISTDLDLAEFVEAIPELKEAKTKDDAIKVMKKTVRDHKRRKVVEALKEERAKKPEMAQQEELVRGYNIGDFLIKAKDIEKESVNLVELDPPFSINLTDIKRYKSRFAQLVSSYEEKSTDIYPEWIKAILQESYRILKPNSWLLLWFAPDPWFELMHNIAQSVGFEGNKIPAIWDKLRPGQCNTPKRYLASSYEMFFYFRKGDARIVKEGRSNVYSYRPVPSQHKEHATEKPVELYEDLLATFVTEGAHIASPCLGSGNVLLAANNYNCTGFGYDTSQTHKDAFILKVHARKPGTYASYDERSNT